MSLREMAQLATDVAEMLEQIDSIQDHIKFSELQDKLCKLRQYAKDSEIVRKAFVIWYKYGLTNFIEKFVKPVENQMSGWDKWHQTYCGDTGDGPDAPPGLIMSWETVNFFMHRSYLGDDFDQIFSQVKDMALRIIEAYKSQEGLCDFWKERLEIISRHR